MAILCALHVASEYCLNNVADSHEATEEKKPVRAPVPVQLSGWQSPVEAVVFCTAKTILGLKALVLVFHCSSFVLIHP